MWSKRLSGRESASWVRPSSLAALIMAACVAGAVVTGHGEGDEAERPPEKSSPEKKRPPGPQDTDFNSPGFKICKVVRIERTLNALGIAALFGKTNKVGKYVELPKRLDPSQRGEEYIITWKFSGKKRPGKAVFQLEYKTSNEDDVKTVTKEYPDLKRGRYHLGIANTGTKYRERGRIEYWRVSILADGELVARKESFLWPLFRGDDGDRAPGGT